MQFASPMVNAVGATVDEARIDFWRGGARRVGQPRRITSIRRSGQSPGRSRRDTTVSTTSRSWAWELTLLNY